MSQDKKPKQSMELTLVTPEMVLAWKQAMRNYRNPSEHRILRLCNVIQTGGWVCDGTPFRFDSKGNWIDGQHRGEAIFRSGIPCWAWICRGIDDDTSVDTGHVRSFAQWLQKNPHGMSTGEAKHAGSALSFLWRHRRGYSLLCAQSTRPQIGELISMLTTQTTEIAQACRIGNLNELLTGSHVAFVYLALETAHRSSFVTFLDKVRDGEHLPSDDPARRLHDAMLLDRNSKAKLPHINRLALLVIAWNAWINSRPIKLLRWNQVGHAAMPFPTIQFASPT